MNRKTIIAAVVAVALALSPFAARPVAAEPGGQDYARILLGLLAAGAIAKALENERERERESQRVTRERPYEDPFTRDDRRHRSYWLPERCEFDVRTRQGWTSAYGLHCLEREGVRVSRLPSRCAFDIRTDRGLRTVYGSRCLRDHGYRVEARRH